jgi:hypothetical protein
MGRAARGPREPGDLNRGDAGRLVMAHGACVIILSTDLRVQQHYEQWSRERDRLVTAGPPAGVTSETDVDAMLHWQHDAEIDALAAILLEMGVPWRWVAEALILKVFPILTHNARHPQNRLLLQVSADGLTALPAGRKPRHHGQDVRQWVEWWYRHKIKAPTDSIYALAQEYAIREKRHTRADSVVEDGIQRAENLLNRVLPRKVPPSGL